MNQDEVKKVMASVNMLKYKDLNTLQLKEVWDFSAIMYEKLAVLEKVKHSRIKQAWAGHGAYKKAPPAKPKAR